MAVGATIADDYKSVTLEACTYQINGKVFYRPKLDVSLLPASSSGYRIDVLVVDWTRQGGVVVAATSSLGVTRSKGTTLPKVRVYRFMNLGIGEANKEHYGRLGPPFNICDECLPQYDPKVTNNIDCRLMEDVEVVPDGPCKHHNHPKS